MKTIDSRLKSRVYGSGRGSVFTPSDFLDIGVRDAVDQALSRLAANTTRSITGIPVAITLHNTFSDLDKATIS
ncbi:MAG: hypothetical protein ACREGC_04425 [Minisyncoccia bacterium]